MSRKDFQALQSSLRAVESALDQMDRRAERMELILMVREPGSAAAADAYEGLRKQVVAVVTDRLTRLTQLVQFDSAIRNGADLQVLSKMVAGWCEAAGLVIMGDARNTQADILFELVEDQGGELEVVDPAYLDASSGRVIRRGRARRRPPRERLGGTSAQAVDSGVTAGIIGTVEPSRDGVLDQDGEQQGGRTDEVAEAAAAAGDEE